VRPAVKTQFASREHREAGRRIAQNLEQGWERPFEWTFPPDEMFYGHST
jgi:hypothetical protein